MNRSLLLDNSSISASSRGSSGSSAKSARRPPTARAVASSQSGKTSLAAGSEAPARKVVSDSESWCQRTSDRVCGQHVLKCLYLVTRSLDPTGTGQKRWTMRWKPALNAFAITFADRMPVSENN